MLYVYENYECVLVVYIIICIRRKLLIKINRKYKNDVEKIIKKMILNLILIYKLNFCYWYFVFDF